LPRLGFVLQVVSVFALVAHFSGLFFQVTFALVGLFLDGKLFNFKSALHSMSTLSCCFVMVPLYQMFNVTAMYFFKNFGQGLGLKVRYLPNQQVYYSTNRIFKTSVLGDF